MHQTFGEYRRLRLGLDHRSVQRPPVADLYPSGNPFTADQIMEQVHFVNHFYAFKNYAITDDKDNITVLVIKGEGKTPTTKPTSNAT